MRQAGVGRLTSIGLTAAVVLTIALGLARDAGASVQGDTTLVSRIGLFGQGGDDDSDDTSISADGRFVAFRSDADNLIPDQDTSVGNIFLRDTQQGTLTLVSRATDGSAADESSFHPSVSADGRFVAFASNADNLSTDDDNDVTNIYVRDVQQGTTTLVSRATGKNGSALNGENSNYASISADGRFVAFHSDADNLSPADDNNVNNVFVRDTQLGTTKLVSREGVSGPGGTNGGSFDPSISADGRFVAFASDSDNLSTDDNDIPTSIYLRDTQEGVTTLVSRPTGPPDPTGTTEDSFHPAISADGRFVAFASDANNLSTDDNDFVRNVFVRDTQQGVTSLVSRPTGADGPAGATDGSFNPSISEDGRFVAFASDANNFSTDDNDDGSNIFVRDTQLETTTLVSRPSGTTGPAPDEGLYANDPSVSSNGRNIAFAALTDRLSPDADDSVRNAYVRDVLGAPPTNLEAPRIAGSALPGGTLECFTGAWSGDPILTGVWLRDGFLIDGASGDYAVTSDDVGHQISCLITATNDGGSAFSESDAVGVVPASSQGPQGPQGAQGPKGDPGPQGEPALKLLLAAFPASVRARTGHRVKVGYVSTLAGRATLTVRRGSKKVATIRAATRAGRNTIAWNGKRAGKKAATGRYKLALSVRSSDGQTATDQVKATLRR